MSRLPSRAGALVMVLALVLSASAQTVFDGTASTVSQTFTPYYEDWMESYPAASSIKFSVPSPGTFSYNFSTAGDVPMRVTWSAPVGQQFVFTAPAGFSTTLWIIFSGGNAAIGGGFGTSAPIVNFQDLSGSLSGATSSVGFTAPGVPVDNGIFSAYYSASIAPGDTVSFSSVSFDWVVPAGYNNVFSGVPIYDFYVQGTAAQNADVANPGAWAGLTAPIPEPGTSAAIGGLLALIATGWWRRRRTASA